MKSKIQSRLMPAEQALAGTNKPRLVMVGNGMAGCRTLEELLKLAPDM